MLFPLMKFNLSACQIKRMSILYIFADNHLSKFNGRAIKAVP